MNTVQQGTTRATHEFPIWGKGEICSLPKRKKLPWVCMAWGPVLILLFIPGLYFYFHHGINEVISVPRDGQYRMSSEKMIRKDFEKWSAAKLKSFENSLQAMRMKADTVQGGVSPEAQRAIDQWETLLPIARERFSDLQSARGESWNEARGDMNAVLRDLERAYHQATIQLTGGIWHHILDDRCMLRSLPYPWEKSLFR